MTAHELETIATVLDTIAIININSCCSTTFDQGIAECAKQKIIQELAKQHGIVYNTIPKSTVIFPVTTHEKSQSSF
jgi:cyclic lactone autoinducer peptide